MSDEAAKTHPAKTHPHKQTSHSKIIQFNLTIQLLNNIKTINAQ